MPPDVSRQTAEIAKARSAAYSLMACALGDPDDALMDSLGDADRWQEWPSIIQNADAQAGQSLADLKKYIVSSDNEQDHLRDTHLRLFGHTVRSLIPPYELEYGQGEINRQASELADINGFYSAFGMELMPGEHERTDHVSIECEFMSVLAVKEAFASAAENQEAYGVVRDAERHFLQDHLGCWLPSFARRIQDNDPEGFYGTVARFAQTFVAMDCNHFKIEIGQPLLALRPADPVLDANIDCGTGNRVPGAQGDSLVQVGVDPSLSGSVELEDHAN